MLTDGRFWVGVLVGVGVVYGYHKWTMGRMTGNNG